MRFSVLGRACSYSYLGLGKSDPGPYMVHNPTQASAVAESEQEGVAAVEVCEDGLAVGRAVELMARGVAIVSSQEPSYDHGETCSFFRSVLEAPEELVASLW